MAGDRAVHAVRNASVPIGTYHGLVMAVPAKKLPNRDPNGRFSSSFEIQVADKKEAAAKLYGLGFTRAKIAHAMAHIISPTADYKSTRRILLGWEQDKDFRDMVYKFAVVKMDMATPQVLEGITRQAKRGRVDAAKLHLAVTERHTDKSEMPTELTIRLEGVTRPERPAIRPGREGESQE